jgi:hypothetical protein
VDVPVLVAADVLEVDDVLVVLCPKIDANPAQTVLGDRSVILAPYGRADRSDPDVQDAGHGGEVGKAPPVRGETGLSLLGVAEEDFTWDQGWRRRFEVGHLFLFLIVLLKV